MAKPKKEPYAEHLKSKLAALQPASGCYLFRDGKGDVVYVGPDDVHQFRNTGDTPLKFLCLIPHPLRGMNGPCAAACGCD